MDSKNELGMNPSSLSDCYSEVYLNFGEYCVIDPTQISGLSDITDVAAGSLYYGNRTITQGVFVQSGGAVYTLGDNQTTPTQISGLSGIVQAGFGYDDGIVALDNAGNVWTVSVGSSLGTPAEMSGISDVTGLGIGVKHLMMLSSE